MKYTIYFRRDENDEAFVTERDNMNEALKEFALMAHNDWGITEDNDHYWCEDLDIVVIDENGSRYVYETDIDMDPTFEFTEVNP